MAVFVTRRLIVSFFIVLASTALMYVLVALSGNPLHDLLEYSGPGRAERIADRTRALNLDVPIPGRYGLWLQDVGKCIVPGGNDCTLGLDRAGRPVLPQLQTAIGSTLRLVVAATVLALLIGVVAGIVTALRQYSTFDYGVTFVAFLCFSLPVFWVSTLLKQYIAIDLNNWLADPTMSYAALLAVALIAGVLWAVVVGGERRTRWLVFGISALATFTTLFLLLTTDWFTKPSLGVAGILVIGLGMAFLWAALFAGLRPRTRRVLWTSLATAAIGTVVIVAAQPLMDDMSWLTFFLMALVLVGIGVAAGLVGGGHVKRLAAQIGAVTGVTMTVLMAVDQMLSSYPFVYRATGGRPIPTTGSETPNLHGDFWQTNTDLALHLVLPTLAIMLISFATYTRYTRASMLDVLNQDYVRTARAKGLNERTVIVRHSFRNALIPLATLVAFDFAGVLSGAVVTETVFGWSGMGRLFQTGLTNVDPNPVMAFFLVTAIATVLFNLVADIAYAYLDPRIRLS
jgi:peptide/nickel transport system permease protein